MTDYNDRAFAKCHMCQVKSRTNEGQSVYFEVARMKPLLHKFCVLKADIML